MSPLKRKALSVEEKARIIRRIEKGEPNASVSKAYGIAHSTVSAVWKNREKIIALFENNSLKMKRLRPSNHKVIEKILLKWCKQQRMNNVVLNGPILQQKANEVAQQVGKNIQISASWVQRFRTRHHIALKKVYDTTDVTDSINPILTPSEEWLSQIWPALCEGYSANEIFSTAETVLHYNIKPDELLKITDTNILQSKEKVALLVTANMTGSSKEKLLLIGEPKQSEYLNNFQSVIYENSTDALLTSEIFEKWLRSWDKELKSKNEKILLLINNSSLKTDTLNLNCIKLVDLPNETSILQPMDQVVRSFKTEYRKLQLWQMFHNREPNTTESLLDAILLISEAWEKVTPNAIVNAFQKAGLIDLPILKPDPDENELLLARLASGIDEHDNTFLVQSASKLLDNSKSRTDIEFSINNDDVAMFEATIDEIKEERRSSAESSDDNVDNEKQEFKTPSLSEAINAVTTLQKFIAFNKEFYSDVNNIVLKELKCQLQKAFELKISEQA